MEPQQGQAPETQIEENDGQEPSGQEQQAPDIDALLKEIKTLRKESAGWRTKLRQSEEAEQKRARDEMTELERVKADLESERQARSQAEQRQREQLLRTQIISSAARAGFADPDDAIKLLDVSVLDIDDSGKIDGLEAALQALVKAKPYLVKSSGTISPTYPSGGRSEKPSDEQLRKEMFGTRKSSLFDGGGVFQVEK